MMINRLRSTIIYITINGIPRRAGIPRHADAPERSLQL